MSTAVMHNVVSVDGFIADTKRKNPDCRRLRPS
jgi:hypothetical protein